MIGFAMCGSFCTHNASLNVLKELCKEYEVLPILSESVFTTDTRFGKATDLISCVESVCGHKPIHSVKDAEPLGPRTSLDCLIICPCTGNTLAKIALGITDTAVTMAAKAHLRCGRPLLISLASNDAMSANLKNIATLLNRKNVFFTPMYQDDPQNKPHSLVSDFSKVIPSIRSAMNGVQMRPIFLTNN